MKATELRIGNLLEFEGNPCPVVQVDEDGFTISNAEWQSKMSTCYYEQGNPIPLTEKWLVKLGWIKVDQGSGAYYWNERQIWFHIHISEDGSIYANFNGNVVYIKYVHQLQNLYFALTGEELLFYVVNP